MKSIFLKTVSFEIGAWLTGGFTFLLRSVRSKHRTVDHENETITVDFWGSQLLMFFTEATAFQQTVATIEWLQVGDTQRKHSLVCKIKKKTSYYRKQTNHWNCWVTWNNFWIEVKQNITHTIQQSISWLLVISRTALCRLDTTTGSSYPYLLKTKVATS